MGNNLEIVHCPDNQPRLGLLTVPFYIHNSIGLAVALVQQTCCYMMYMCHLQGVVCIPASATLGSRAAPADAEASDAGGKTLTSAEDRSHHENIH